jgi:acyl carrier protein
MHVLLAVLGTVALLVGALWLHARSNRRLVQRRFADREPLSEDQFGRQYFSKTQAPIAARLRALLGDELGLDLARLRPEDEPVRHLRVEEFDSLAVAEFVIATEKAFDVTLREQDLVTIRTFGELVALVDREVKAGERTA